MQSLSEDFQNLKRLVVAQLETSFGYDRNLPASSCQQVLNYNSSSPNGYYWIVSADGNAVLSYCDMTRTCGNITGGWMRITALDMRVANTSCPSGLRERVHPGQRLCGRDVDDGCSQVFYNTPNVQYSDVCGKIIAYQFYTTDAFGLDLGHPRNNTIDDVYLNGISLTYSSNPRKHIWSFAAALDKRASFPEGTCPCTNVNTSGATPPPSFVGDDYFCDTGAEAVFAAGEPVLFAEDPLWDGAGCGPDNTCCSLNNPPWFFKHLQSSTSDDIEMRVCGDESIRNEDIRIEQIEIYVH